MIEDELRDAFSRQETQIAEVGTLRQRIEQAVRRRRRRRRTLQGSALVALTALALVAPPMLIDRVGGSQRPAAAPTEAPSPALNLLLIGTDDFYRQGPWRADSLTLVHIPADRKKAYLISIERDLLVDIPGHGKAKINQSYMLGGAKLVETVVESMLQAEVDGTATVSQQALRKITDALGGVEMCLNQNIKSHHTGKRYQAGCQGVDGAGAIDILRQRYPYEHGAYERDRNQQRFLAGLAGKVSELDLLTDAGKVKQLIELPGKDLTVDFQAELSLLDLAWQLRGISADDLVGISQPTFNTARDGNGTGYGEAWDAKVGPELLAALRQGTLDQFAERHPDWVTELRGPQR